MKSICILFSESGNFEYFLFFIYLISFSKLADLCYNLNFKTVKSQALRYERFKLSIIPST